MLVLWNNGLIMVMTMLVNVGDHKSNNATIRFQDCNLGMIKKPQHNRTQHKLAHCSCCFCCCWKLCELYQQRANSINWMWHNIASPHPEHQKRVAIFHLAVMSSPIPYNVQSIKCRVNDAMYKSVCTTWVPTQHKMKNSAKW